MSQPPSPNSKTIVLPLLVAALLGGGVAAGVTAFIVDDSGGDTHTTTVIRQSALASQGANGKRSDAADGLTAGRHLPALRARCRLRPLRDHRADPEPVRPVRRHAAQRVHRLGLRHRRRRRHPHQQPRDRRRHARLDHCPVRRQEVRQGDGRRQGPVDRPRAAEGRPRGAGPQAAAARLLQGRPRRRPDDRDRQPLRPGPHADHRRRLGPAAPDPGAQRLRRSRTSSRPTRRSTRATRAAR